MSERGEDATIVRVADAMRSSEYMVRRALSALRPGDPLPGGLVVVPEEPTEAMLDATYGAEIEGDYLGVDDIAIIYRIMLRAAQEGTE